MCSCNNRKKGCGHWRERERITFITHLLSAGMAPHTLPTSCFHTRLNNLWWHLLDCGGLAELDSVLVPGRPGLGELLNPCKFMFLCPCKLELTFHCGCEGRRRWLTAQMTVIILWCLALGGGCPFFSFPNTSVPGLLAVMTLLLPLCSAFLRKKL